MPTTSRRTDQADAAPEAATTTGDIILSGPPGQLRAQVTVENNSTTRLSVRAPTLHLDGHDPFLGVGVAQIAPGATAVVPLLFRLDEAMPPGHYRGELEIGGQRRSVFLDVSPVLSMRVHPDRLLADPGSQPITLAVSNNGNVRMPLCSLTLARTDDGGPARSTADSSSDVALVLEDPGTVEPGTTRTVGGHLDVPGDLDPARRHVAVLPVGVADLTVIILPRNASETKS